MAQPMNWSVKVQPVTALHPYKNNARTHSKKQLKQIAESIRVFGFTNPILVDRENGVIAGHGRVDAAKMLGMSDVPTICLEHLSEDQKRAYIIADNKLAENAGWDKEILRIELQHLIELDFDIQLTGFEIPEIDILLQEGKEDTTEEEVVPEAPINPVTQLGDLWQLGEHRLYCGDALKPESYDILLGNNQAQMIFTDPPYNVKVNGHVCGNGKIKHREFAMASGEMDADGFTQFLELALGNMARVSVDGSIHFVCMDWRHIQELASAGQAVYTELKNLCVWNKDNGGMGSLYRSKHELVFVFKHGTEPHVNNIELGKYGRYRTNVWDYAGVNTLRNGREDELAMHPTVKPVSMVADAILDCSKPKKIVLDPFAGSGTTLIAAEKTGRKGYVMELDPSYVDVIINRWQNLTGKQAILASKNKTFEDVKGVRHG
jgi:DNA modification methylase